MPKQSGVRRPYDGEGFERLTKNVAALLKDLIKETNGMASRTHARRKKVFVDLRLLADDIPKEDHGVLTRLEEEVQRVVDAKGSPKISVSSGCVGRTGGSVNATEDGATVGACAIVEGGNVTGGGVQGSVAY